MNSRRPVPEGPYDLVVIGGGINGTGIARDAVLRGHSVALFEKGDLASGTSGSTSKMLHGGIRYLEQLRLGLVHEALRERHLALRLAPHLVSARSFVVPVYEGGRRSLRWIRLGLLVYDALSLGRRPGSSRLLTREEVLARVPDLRPEGLQGGGLYWDAVVDDARLCVLVAVTACEEARARSLPFVLRTYTEVLSWRATTPVRLEVLDRLTGRTQRVLAHRVARAVGPWTEPERLVPSKGVHLVLPPFPTRDAILLEHSQDGRPFFLVPWWGMTVIGTTETPAAGPPDGLRVEAIEVDYLLGELQALFPRLRFGREDILGVYCGVRPLARSAGIDTWIQKLRGRPQPVGRVSRKHRIVEDSPGVVTVFGGKYTTYRAAAREVVDRLLPGRPCETHRHPIAGGEEGDWERFRPRAQREIERHGEEAVLRLYRRYGCRLGRVLALAADPPPLAEPIVPGAPELRAEVVHAIREEFTTYPEDFLCRRSAARFALDGGRNAYPAVEELVARFHPSPPGDLDRARERYLAERRHEDELRRGGTGVEEPAGSPGPP